MNSERGFTLIEVILTIIVLAVVGAFVARPLIDMVQTQSSISGVAASQADREYAITRMAKAIRLSDFSEPVSCGDFPETLSVGDDDFVYDAGAKALALNGEVIVSGIDDFQCERLDSRLRLYELVVGVQTAQQRPQVIRAFKREAN